MKTLTTDPSKIRLMPTLKKFFLLAINIAKMVNGNGIKKFGTAEKEKISSRIQKGLFLFCKPEDMLSTLCLFFSICLAIKFEPVLIR